MIQNTSERYERNRETISAKEQQILAEKSVCVVGCGGLGGCVIELLARLGVGKITVVDGDRFEPLNLNRQLLSNESNIGCGKAREAAMQMRLINSSVTVTPVEAMLNAENGSSIVRGHDVAIDALDNIKTRIILEQACEAENIPLVHGAISGWNGQVGVSMPGNRLIQTIYDFSAEGEIDNMGNPSFTPAFIASLEAAEALKLLLGRGDILKNKLLQADILTHRFEILSFD